MPVPKPPSRRGGRRPGAGAPRGNLNALKHGGRSRQFAQIGALLAANPEIQLTLLDLAQRHLNRQLKAEEVAALWLTRLLEHAHAIARGEKSRGPFSHLADEGARPEPGDSRSRRARGEPSRGPFEHLLHGTAPGPLKEAQSKKRRRSPAAAATKRPRSRTKTRNNNQTSGTDPEINQPPDTKSAPESDD